MLLECVLQRFSWLVSKVENLQHGQENDVSKSCRFFVVQKPRLLDVFLFPVPKPPGSWENLGSVNGTSLKRRWTNFRTSSIYKKTLRSLFVRSLCRTCTFAKMWVESPFEVALWPLTTLEEHVATSGLVLSGATPARAFKANLSCWKVVSWMQPWWTSESEVSKIVWLSTEVKLDMGQASWYGFHAEYIQALTSWAWWLRSFSSTLRGRTFSMRRCMELERNRKIEIEDDMKMIQCCFTICTASRFGLPAPLA